MYKDYFKKIICIHTSNNVLSPIFSCSYYIIHIYLRYNKIIALIMHCHILF